MYSLGFGPDAVRDLDGSASVWADAWYWFVLIAGGAIAVWAGVSAIDKLREWRSNR
jgi:hypothetical protein